MTDASFPDTPASDKTRLTAFLLGVFTGIFGGHRFYVGRTGSAVAMLCTLGGCGLWWMYDCITIVTGEFTDGRGRRLVRWTNDEMLDLPGPPDAVYRELDQLRGDVGELHERVDFLERMLAEAREPRRMPPSA